MKHRDWNGVNSDMRLLIVIRNAVKYAGLVGYHCQSITLGDMMTFKLFHMCAVEWISQANYKIPVYKRRN